MKARFGLVAATSALANATDFVSYALANTYDDILDERVTLTIKDDLLVYDYVDSGVPALARMAAKRQSGYRSLGYDIAREASRFEFEADAQQAPNIPRGGQRLSVGVVVRSDDQ